MKMDEVTIEPTCIGPHGRAWQLDIEKIRKDGLKDGTFKQDDLDKDSSVGIWMVEAPWAHPAWHSYLLVLVHLRDNGLPTKFYLKGATHEIWLYALDPDGDRQSLLERGINKNCRWLTPNNYADQFIAANDAEAFQRVEICVHEICAGALNPDTDAQGQWIKRFGGHMMKRL